MIRVAIRLVAVLALVAAALLAPTTGSAPSTTAQAADLSKFDPGNIVSDAVFYDAGSMSAADVQAFLDARGRNCTAGDLCLKNYSVATTDRGGDSLCKGYQANGTETAAVIITRVAVSCGVSPKVLLVLLQKEMGLVTATAPTAKSYERAAGYACPDSANGGCDPAYAGLQNQLYRSAWQYKKYRATPDNYSFVAGRYNTIAWSTKTSCGTSRVFIVNQATAGLYNYTPYRPNQASLNAGYGASSDPCAQYGNRNFYNYFTDWFGSTGYRLSGGIGGFYVAQGGGTGPLGAPAGEMFCGITNGGCAQFFAGGVIYWSPSTGAHPVSDAVLTTWKAQGWEGGPLGYPTTNMVCGMVAGGCGQFFSGGAIYWSPGAGAHAVSGGVLGTWGSLGWEGGPLGYPAGGMFCGITAGGCGQFFTGGVVYWSPTTGAHAVSGAVLNTWKAQGWEGGPLGYPIAEMECGLANGGCSQDFSGGSVQWSPGTGARAVSGDILDSWQGLGGEMGPLGYPTAERSCGLTNGGCMQSFSGGVVYSASGTGAYAVSGGVLASWQALGRQAGPLGYPTAEMACGLADGGCGQTFAGGAIYWSPSTGAHAVSGGTMGVWQSLGAQNGLLGYPTGGMFCGITAGGCGQFFTGGVVYWSSSTGAHAVLGAIRDTWRSRGWEGGPLGYPTAGRVPVSVGWQQQFQGGTVTWNTSSGAVTVAP